jgi:hypothetical protein
VFDGRRLKAGLVEQKFPLARFCIKELHVLSVILQGVGNSGLIGSVWATAVHRQSGEGDRVAGSHQDRHCASGVDHDLPVVITFIGVHPSADTPYVGVWGDEETAVL